MRSQGYAREGCAPPCRYEAALWELALGLGYYELFLDGDVGRGEAGVVNVDVSLVLPGTSPIPSASCGLKGGGRTTGALQIHFATYMNWVTPGLGGAAAKGLNRTIVRDVPSKVAVINRLMATNLNFLILRPPLVLGTFLSQRPSSALSPKRKQQA